MIQLIEQGFEVEVKLDITPYQAIAIADRFSKQMIDLSSDSIIFGKPLPGGSFADIFAIETGPKLCITLERPQDPLDGTSFLPLDDLDFQLQVLTRLRELMA